MARITCIHEDKSGLSLCFNQRIKHYNCMKYELCIEFESCIPIKKCECGEYIKHEKESCNDCLIKTSLGVENKS